MQTIDSHHHFWKYNLHKHAWIDDEMSILKKDYLPDNLKSVFDKNSIDGSIAVQADQSEEETDFLLTLSNTNSFIRGVVGWIDLRSENIQERLEKYANKVKLVGFRHVVQNEPDVNFMLGEDFLRGIASLENYNFTYDILIFPTQLDAAIGLVERFPNQPFVLDHIAKPYIKDDLIEDWETKIRKLALHENVYCKVSGMVTEANWTDWNQSTFIPYLDVIFSAFGVDRIMFGSDYPVCLLAGEQYSSR